jgi:hypothetical protein
MRLPRSARTAPASFDSAPTTTSAKPSLFMSPAVATETPTPPQSSLPVTSKMDLWKGRSASRGTGRPAPTGPAGVGPDTNHDVGVAVAIHVSR